MIQKLLMEAIVVLFSVFMATLMGLIGAVFIGGFIGSIAAVAYYLFTWLT